MGVCALRYLKELAWATDQWLQFINNIMVIHGIIFAVTGF